MKMKIEQILFVLIGVFAILIDKSNIAVEGAFLVMLLGSFSIAYLGLGWYFFRNKASKIKSLIFSIPISMLSSLLLIAILLKLQPWPNFDLLIISLVGLGILLFALVFSYFSTTSKQNKKYYINLISKTLVNAFIAVVFIYVEFNF